ncbi:MAG: geranylgeranylglyceryl/heptaprenylglyceryl phosphate synthase, partial [Pseudomonadota bacterium]
VAGVTGSGSADPEDIRAGVEMAQRVSGLPVCVGFGIKNGDQAAAMAQIADGVVVGSAFVEQARLATVAKTPQIAVDNMGKLAQELSTALKGGASAT